MKISHILARGAGSIGAAAATLAFTLAPFAALADGPTSSTASASHSAGGSISGGSGGANVFAHLTVVTHVLDLTNNGSKASDWTMVVTNVTTHAVAATFSGSEKGATVNLKPGTYDVTEKGGSVNIGQTNAQNCVVTLTAGEKHTCTFVNTGEVSQHGGNTAPAAQDMSITTNMNTPVSIHLNVLEAVNIPLSYAVSAPMYGTLSGTAPNLVYTPNQMFNGTDSFTYSATDGNAFSTTAKVTISVNLVQGHGHGTQNAGQVLGAATSTVGCIPTLTKYLRPGASDNDVDQVKALQTLLNKDMNTGLPVTGDYDAATTDAVKAFQTKYAADILTPWGITEPTGIAYITTVAALDKIDCPTNAQGIPPLVVWSYAQGN